MSRAWLGIIAVFAILYALLHACVFLVRTKQLGGDYFLYFPVVVFAVYSLYFFWLNHIHKLPFPFKSWPWVSCSLLMTFLSSVVMLFLLLVFFGSTAP